MPSPRTLTVISLDGGVQSSVMTFMAGEGAYDRLRFPLRVVDNGRSLSEDVKDLTNHSGSRQYVDIPVYNKGRDREGDGDGRCPASPVPSSPAQDESRPSAAGLSCSPRRRRSTHGCGAGWPAEDPVPAHPEDATCPGSCAGRGAPGGGWDDRRTRQRVRWTLWV